MLARYLRCSKASRKKKTSKEEVKNEVEPDAMPLVEKFTANLENETDHKIDLKQLSKDIDDESLTDEMIVEKFETLLNIFEGVKSKLAEARFGSDDFSFLHLASKNFRADLCKFLISMIQIGVNVNSKSKLTPLHVLVRTDLKSKKSIKAPSTNLTVEKIKEKFTETFKVLIGSDADCNARDENEYAPIHYAALKNNVLAVSLLLELAQLDLQAVDKKKLTALHICCRDGFERVACKLIEKTSAEELSNSDSLAVHLACRNKIEQARIVETILDKLRAESTPEKNYLEEAIKKLDSFGQPLLHVAIENDHSKIVHLLLDKYQADKELEDLRSGNLPVHVAAKHCSINSFDVLKEHDAVSFKVNNNLDNALHLAAANLNGFKFIGELIAYEKKMRQAESNRDSTTAANREPYLINALNKNNYTPLFIAIASDHLRCVQELLKADNLDLDAKDANENTMYHICAQFNTVECLRHLLIKKNAKLVEPLFHKNSSDDTVIHVACQHGHIEIVKLFIMKLSESIASMESFLTLKNKDGYNGFHIACIKGFYNIVEYFLKDLKLVSLLKSLDNDANTCLHLASLNGHLSIVNLLINCGADLYAKNENNNTALELSCRKGYFEISKILITNYSKIVSHSSDVQSNDHPLHVACYEGAHEVVKLLLLKGAEIDRLNDENHNCLDIAISRGHREVIKILLADPNWYKLIEVRSETASGEEQHRHKQQQQQQVQLNRRPTKMDVVTMLRPGKRVAPKKENPQLCAMFEKKMWDMIKIVLDNCVRESSYDFSKLDPPCKNYHKHPLMLMARSGQETLLKHEATQLLLKLKWRHVPRIAFYTNTLFYLTFLILFGLYAIQLSNQLQTMNSSSSVDGPQNYTVYMNSLSSDYQTSLGEMDGEITTTMDPINNSSSSLPPDNNYVHSYIQNSSGLVLALIIIILLHILKVLCQIVFLDRLSYFTSLQNWLESFTYIGALVACLSSDMNTKSAYASLSILSSFIVFSFLIQKVQLFGVYVLAFRRTLMNSAKFFPIFVLIYVGFLLSFRIRANYSVSYFNTAGSSIIRTLTMVVGEIDTDRMGLEDPHALTNYILYCLFLSIMCVIVLNLFVGIAVGEIKTVLDEADIQQISMRIIFVLNVESSLVKFSSKIRFLKRILSMRYTSYSYGSESRFVKSRDRLIKLIKKSFKSTEPSIKLVDPQKRLEDSLLELSRSTSEDLNSIKENLVNQLSDVQIKLSNSQQRLEDQLLEMARKTMTNFETNKEDSTDQISFVESKLLFTQRVLKENLEELNSLTNKRLMSIKQSVASKLRNVETNLEKRALNQFSSISAITESMSGQVNEMRTSVQLIADELFNMKKMSINYQEKINQYSLKMDEIGESIRTTTRSMQENNQMIERLKESNDEILKSNGELKELYKNQLEEQKSMKQTVDLIRSESLKINKEDETNSKCEPIDSNESSIETKETEKAEAEEPTTTMKVEETVDLTKEETREELGVVKDEEKTMKETAEKDLEKKITTDADES